MRAAARLPIVSRGLIRRLALLLALATALGGCDSSPRVRAEKKMHAVGPERLRRDAALLYKDLFASTGPSFTALKSSQWPESFRKIGPLSVGAYADGFSLAIEQEGGEEAGLYIVPVQMDLQPASRGRAHFELMADGIYWYSFRRE